MLELLIVAKAGLESSLLPINRLEGKKCLQSIQHSPLFAEVKKPFKFLILFLSVIGG
jgi:hypothetical protein